MPPSRSAVLAMGSHVCAPKRRAWEGCSPICSASTTTITESRYRSGPTSAWLPRHSRFAPFLEAKAADVLLQSRTGGPYPRPRMGVTSGSCRLSRQRCAARGFVYRRGSLGKPELRARLSARCSSTVTVLMVRLTAAAGVGVPLAEHASSLLPQPGARDRERHRRLCRTGALSSGTLALYALSATRRRKRPWRVIGLLLKRCPCFLRSR